MKIAIIGSGNMGGAIAHGLIQSCFCPASDILCTAKSLETLEKLKQLHPDLQTTRDNVSAIQQATIIILAVKPWLIKEIMEDVKDFTAGAPFEDDITILVIKRDKEEKNKII